MSGNLRISIYSVLQQILRKTATASLEIYEIVSSDISFIYVFNRNYENFDFQSGPNIFWLLVGIPRY